MSAWGTLRHVHIAVFFSNKRIKAINLNPILIRKGGGNAPFETMSALSAQWTTWTRCKP